MATMRVDKQGRVVLSQPIRRRLGIEGRSAELEVTETPDGFLIELPAVHATVEDGSDGLPSITIDGLEGPIENGQVISSIDAERARR